MDLRLTGKVAIMTGASKGIGLAVTRALVEEGAFVVAGSRRSSTGLAALAETGQVHPVAVDLSTPTGPAELVATASDGGRLDILVNNVGAVSPWLAGFLEVTDEQWLTSIAAATCRSVW